MNASPSLRKWLRRLLQAAGVLALLLLFIGLFNVFKPLPDGISFAGDWHGAKDVRFLRDLTFVDETGQRHVEQQIFDAVFEMIDGAREFVLVDMFLFNDFQGASPETTHALCRELTDRLVARRAAVPEIEIHFITDPINTVYGGLTSPHLEELRQAGVNVTMTRLNRLRDSNPLYSSFWRLLFLPFGNSEGGWLPNPFGDGKVSLRSYLALANFKANHRKVVIADTPDGLRGLVTSANPHDGSSAHQNVALQFGGPAVVDLLEAERAVIRFSSGQDIVFRAAAAVAEEAPAVEVQIVSEGQIKRAVLAAIDRTTKGDSLDLVMFYLSDRDIIQALLAAQRRGVAMRVVLDPNKDAFGHEKNGIPNRQVAEELTASGVPLRWADTHGEQCHSKLLLVRRRDGTAWLTAGSANYTRRNLADLNLELNAAVRGAAEAAVFVDALAYVELIWEGRPGRRFTTDFETYRDDAAHRRWLYRFMEATGMSTF
jgi:phosphatidylserine/phosphatidylglycerophosphate/cardiolipin synthase-like enzyme